MLETHQHSMAGRRSGQHEEGTVAQAIEQQTAKLPSDLFLWAAVGAMALSCGLYSSGRRHDALFIGQWPAPLLLLGVYNKIVKLHGSSGPMSG
jgi:hypothetical protein